MDDNNESWAIITGASDGIGKSFAIQLAEMGYSVVLISRSREALEKVQDLIQSKYSVQTIVYPFDFGKYDAANFESLKVAIQAINPCILVNNVGICTEIPTSFLETESAFIRKMVQVNIGAALEMTGIVLPIFDHKNKGLIVNVGSGLGDYSSGLLATYG
jgi:17beta-estradiol 17-dehydrogenase / very-long-chain 3-oxoacyl-CoA reductase